MARYQNTVLLRFVLVKESRIRDSSACEWESKILEVLRPAHTVWSRRGASPTSAIRQSYQTDRATTSTYCMSLWETWAIWKKWQTQQQAAQEIPTLHTAECCTDKVLDKMMIRFALLETHLITISLWCPLSIWRDALIAPIKWWQQHFKPRNYFPIFQVSWKLM